MSKKEIFIVDTNTFITPYKSYYPFDIAPSFWEFFKNNIENGNIIIIDKVFNEIIKGKNDDELSKWIKGISSKQINKPTKEIIDFYREIINYINNNTTYHDNATKVWSESDCADPWLIATAKAYNSTLTTLEKTNNPAKNKLTKEAKIPDIASEFEVECCDLYEMIRRLKFTFK